MKYKQGFYRFFAVILSCVMSMCMFFTMPKNRMTGHAAEKLKTISEGVFTYDLYLTATGTISAVLTGYTGNPLTGAIVGEDPYTITIPAKTQGGYPVVMISSLGSSASGTLKAMLVKSIILPESDSSLCISDKAFNNYGSITEITFPACVVDVGSKLFGEVYFPNLTSVSFKNPRCSINSDMFESLASNKFTGIIYGYSGSTAEEFARANGYNFQVIGSEPVTQPGITTTAVSSTSTAVKSGKCGVNLKWELSGSVLTITGTGAMYNYSRSERPFGGLEFSQVVISDGVTNIGNYVFSDCYTLQSITIPSSVTSIGEYAFLYCYSLTNITLPDSVTSIGGYAFQECSFNSFSIPKGLTRIPTGAFSGCMNLTSITIPDTVTSIGDWAFYDCYNLIIKGYPGSAAETYAQNNNIPFEAIRSLNTEAAITTTTRLTNTTTTTKTMTTVTTLPVTPTPVYSTTTVRVTTTTTTMAATTTITTTTTTTTTAATTMTTTTSVFTTTTPAVSTTTLPALTLNTESLTLTNGGQFTVQPNRTDVTFRSNNPDVAIVSQSGVITAVGIGQAIISVYDAEANVVQITVEVKQVSTEPEPLRGDVNSDGEVSVEDAQLTLQAYTKRIAGVDMGLTEKQLKAANVNGDEELSVDDAQNILKYYTEKYVAGKDITWEDLLGKKPPAQSLPRSLNLNKDVFLRTDRQIITYPF